MSQFDAEGGSYTINNISDLDKERLFRAALNEEFDVNTLLSYYRDRINEFDNHREEWLEKYNKVRTPQDEAHRQAWELQKRKDESIELKQTLEEEKLRLYNERQEIIDIIKENDQLKLKEIQDRKKISELSMLGDPIEQEIVFYKDVKPETINKYMKNDLSIRTNQINYENMLKKTEGKDMAQKIAMTQKTGRGVIKTIYLPNDQLNSTAMENEELRIRLEENRIDCLNQVEQFRAEFNQKEGELQRVYEENQAKIKDYLQKNEKLEEDNINLVKDYFDLILQSNHAERKLNEENELLRLKNAAFANKYRIEQQRARQENMTTTKTINKKSEEYSNRYRQEIRQKDEDLALLKDQYAQIQQIYLQKMKDLEQSLTKLAKKHSTLENRRLLENEGFRTDVKKMRLQVNEYRKLIEKKELDIMNGNEPEGDEEARFAAKEELNLIKKQLNEVEVRLDKARRIKG